MHSRTWLISGALWAALSTPCAAQEVLNWSVDVGVATRIRPDHVGARRYTVDAAPIVAGQFGERLSASFDDGVRWTAVGAGPVRAGPVLEFRQIYNDHLPGNRARFDGDFELGGFVTVATPLGEGEVRLRKALSGYRGWSGDVAWNVGGEIGGGFNLGAEARASWTDVAYLNRQFGLPAKGRPSLSIGRGDSYTAGIEIALSHPVGQRLRATLAVSDDHRLGAGPNSPLYRSRDDLLAGIGITYRFGSRR